MTVTIIDVAEDVTAHLPAIAAAGIKTVIGYLSSISPTGGKCLTPDRVKAIAALELRVGLVHEGWGGVGGKGISSLDGARDATYCAARAPALGAPRGACIYFACDQDFSNSEISLCVLPYFRAIRQAFAGTPYRVGVYGSGAVCAAVITNGLADLSWLAQSRGWSGYATWKPKANMVQGPTGIIGGVSADPDEAQGDIGDFVPFAPIAVPLAATTPTPIDTRPVNNGGWLDNFLRGIGFK